MAYKKSNIEQRLSDWHEAIKRDFLQDEGKIEVIIETKTPSRKIERIPREEVKMISQSNK